MSRERDQFRHFVFSVKPHFFPVANRAPTPLSEFNLRFAVLRTTCLSRLVVEYESEAAPALLSDHQTQISGASHTACLNGKLCDPFVCHPLADGSWRKFSLIPRLP